MSVFIQYDFKRTEEDIASLVLMKSLATSEYDLIVSSLHGNKAVDQMWASVRVLNTIVMKKCI